LPAFRLAARATHLDLNWCVPTLGISRIGQKSSMVWSAKILTVVRPGAKVAAESDHCSPKSKVSVILELLLFDETYPQGSRASSATLDRIISPYSLSGWDAIKL